MKFILLSGLVLLYAISCSSQTIVNTEKLFDDDSTGFSFSSELIGSTIQGNAQLYLIEASLNFSYNWKKESLKLFSGGEYVHEAGQVVSNSLFGQLRFIHHFSDKLRFFSFYQLQQNKILLLNSRQLLGAGFRQNIVSLGTDSSKYFQFDLSVGAMQEEEKLNVPDLGPLDVSYSNYTRAIFSSIFQFGIGDGISIVNTSYYQLYVKGGGDFRFLNETNIMFEIKEWMSISFDIEYRYDNLPPSVLKNSDLNTNVGFVFSL